MPKYLVTYHGSGMPSDPAQIQQAVQAFGKWLGEAGKAVVDPGAPAHMVAQVSNGSPTNPVEIGGYSLIEAASVDEAKAILKTHPFVARGGTLQVNEIMVVS